MKDFFWKIGWICQLFSLFFRRSSGHLSWGVSGGFLPGHHCWTTRYAYTHFKKALLLLNTSPRSWSSKIKTLQTVPFLLFSILWYFRLVAWAAVKASAELAARLVRPPRRKDAPQIGLATASKTMAAENLNLIWFDTNTYSSFSWLVL